MGSEELSGGRVAMNLGEWMEIMLFGHNTNITIAGAVFHVQTEDRGVNHAQLETTVHCRGRVLHRRTNSYFDLLPLDDDRRQALKLRLDDQHGTVCAELRSGVMQLTPPPAPVASVTRVPIPIGGSSHSQPKGITFELTNSQGWLSGRQATLHLVVRQKESGDPVSGAQVTARIEGGAEPTEFGADTNHQGYARIQFTMPRLIVEHAGLVIEAVSGDSRSRLRFQLRAKPRVAVSR
jgi:hypothetical protein